MSAAREPLPEACACESCQDAAWPQAKGHDAATVYVVMGHDEGHGWVVAAYTDIERAEACVEAYQAEADSELEFYRVKELKLNV